MYRVSLTTQIIGIVMLLFTINLSFRNLIIDRYQTKVFIVASSLAIAMLLLEIIEYCIISLGKVEYIHQQKIVVIIGFVLTNVVTYILLSLNDSGKFSKKKLLSIPLLINTFINITTYWTGWIFYIDHQGNYFRGDYFFIQLSINLFYYILLILAIFINEVDYDRDDIIFLSSIFILPIIAIIIQIAYPEYYLIWVTVALSLMLYYIFLRELQFKIDMVSGIRNRRAFTNKMFQLNKAKKKTALIVLDLNDLKKTNDSKGHEEGDKVIYKSAQLLQKIFKDFGTAYRIGGDEFCVLCENLTEDQVEDLLVKLSVASEEYNKVNDVKITFAFGYALYTGNSDIFDVFRTADKKMYEYKVKIKGYYGRRREDKLSQSP